MNVVIDLEKMIGYIYRIYHIETDRSYIGQTTNKNPFKRINDHLSGSSNKELRDDIEFYGKDAFGYEILWGPIHVDELNYMEKYCILEFKSLTPNGYNVSKGGKGFNFKLGKDHPSSRSDVWKQENEIINQYLDGKSIMGLAREYKCDPNTIRNIIRFHGVKTGHHTGMLNHRTRKDILEKESEIISRYENGETIKKIAKSLNGSGPTIRNILKLNNVELRRTVTVEFLFDNKKEDIIHQYLIEKLSMAKIAKNHNSCYETIRKVLILSGVKSRKAGGQRKT